MTPVGSENGATSKNGAVNNYAVLCKSDGLDKNDARHNAAIAGRGRQVDEELIWKVRHVTGNGSQQDAPPKACFYWRRDGQLVRSAEFTQLELEVEIEKLSSAGTDLTQFVLALKLLALSRPS